MARVPFVDLPELPPSHLFRVLGQRPELLTSYIALGRGLVFKGELDQRRKELAILGIARLRNCSYLWSHHSELGRTVGVTDADLSFLAADRTDGLAPEDAAVVIYAQRLDAGTVTDGDTDALSGHGFTAPQVVELTLVAAFYGMTARVLEALDVDLEEGRQGFED